VTGYTVEVSDDFEPTYHEVADFYCCGTHEVSFAADLASVVFFC
jgi:hypothetical protein